MRKKLQSCAGSSSATDQLGLAQLHEQAVFLAADYLLVAERDVNKILAQRAGQ